MNFPVDIVSFFRDSFFLMLGWLLMAMAFHTWGGFFSKFIKLDFIGHKKLFANIWLGWCFSLFWFAVYHLLFPVDALASGMFYFPGILYFLYKYRKKLPSYFKSIGKFKLTIILLVVFSASVIAIQAPMNYDTGLYHLNSIRWANEHHIVQGIGNIHTRLGHNQLFFLYVASLNFHPFLNDYAFHLANSFLYAVFSVGSIISGTFMDLLLLCLFFYLPMPYYWISNPTPDVASTLLQIVAFRWFFEPLINNPKEPRGNYIVFSAILSAIMISVKLSNVVFAIGFGLITVLACLRKKLENIDKKLTGRVFVFIGLFFVFWIIRGYIQTGYPLFPSSIGRINFDWAVPERLAKYTENAVYCGSRTNGQIYDPNSPILKESWAWLDFWIKWNFFDENQYLCDNWQSNLVTWLTLIFVPMIIFNWGMGSVTLFILGFCLFFVWLRAVFVHKGVWKKSIYIFCLFLVGLVSILFWFFVAPEVRFANGSFIVFFCSSLLLVKLAYPNLNARKELKNALFVFPVIMFLWAFGLGYNVNAFRLDGIAVLNKVPMKTFVSDYGVELLIPTLSDQCWDSALPSTPEPEKGLQMRGKSINEGFRILQ